MISIKDRSVLTTILAVPYDEILIEVVTWIAAEYPGKIVITCGYRAGDSRVHGTIPCRAVDIRSWAFTHPDMVANYINLVWEYDHERPDKKVSLVHENRGEEGNHMHLQVHPNTKKRKEQVINVSAS